MIPYPYKFVDFGGVDLAEINGLAVEGIYQRIIDSINRCGELVLYNWCFASIPIAPSYCDIELGDHQIIINDVIEIRQDDTVWVTGLIPDPPVMVPLSVDSNGEYSPLNYGAEGFSFVGVQVPPPALEQKAITENGTYLPSEGYYGFSSVNVDVSSGISTNALLFHFEDFNNSGYLQCAWDQRTGLSISSSVSKFGEHSLECSNTQGINNILLGMDFSLGNQDFTLDFWVYPTSLITSGVYKVPLSFDYRSIAFYLSQQAMQFGVASSNSAWTNISSRSVSITNNEWHHIAITRSGSNVYEFLDGVKVGTVDFGSNAWAQIRYMTLGSNTYQTGDRRFQGYIDELRLKLGEAVWTENFSPPTEPYN